MSDLLHCLGATFISTFARWCTGFRWGIHYAWRHHGAVIEGAAGMTIAAGWLLIPFQWIPFNCIVQFALDPYWLPIDSMGGSVSHHAICIGFIGCQLIACQLQQVAISFHLNSNFQVVVNWYWPSNVLPMGQFEFYYIPFDFIGAIGLILTNSLLLQYRNLPLFCRTRYRKS